MAESMEFGRPVMRQVSVEGGFVGVYVGHDVGLTGAVLYLL